MDKKEKPSIDRPAAAVNFRGSWSGYERDCLFHNPDGPFPKFFNTSFLYGLDFDDDGRSVATVDIDGDGDLDIVMMSLQGLRVMENRLPRKHFARLRLAATKTQRLALNALVRLTAGGVTQQDYVRVTDGFMTQTPADMHFGLGKAEKIDHLTIFWPSGATQEFSGLPADRLIEITEGDAGPRASELKRWPDETRPKARAAYAIGTPAERLEGGEAPVAAAGKPSVVNFWSPTCVPCKEELPLLAELARKQGSDVQFAGVSVETKDIESVKKSVQAFGLPYPQFLANDTLMRSFFGADGKAIMPSTFVFDRSGRLRRVFQRALAAGELDALLASFHEEGVRAADLEMRGAALLEGARLEEAIEVLQKAIALDPRHAMAHFRLATAYDAQGDRIAGEAKDAESARAAAAKAAPLYDRSIFELRAALDVEPEWGRAHYNIAITLHKRERWSEAVEHYQAAIRFQGEDYETLVSLGLAAGRAGQAAAAFDAIDRALKLDAKHLDAWIAKAKVHGSLGQTEEAKKALGEALKLDPSSAEAKAMLRDLESR